MNNDNKTDNNITQYKNKESTLDPALSILYQCTRNQNIHHNKIAKVSSLLCKAIYPESVFEREEQTTFSFDLPLFKQEPVKREPVIEDNKVLFELTNETREIKVNDPVQFVPVTEVADNGIIKYSLEEYMEVENDLMKSKPVEKVVEDTIPEELNITLKPRVDFASQPDLSTTSEVSPLELTIEETLRLRAEERRKKLKEFNYKFHTNSSRLDEMEKVPAYKRMGVDLPTNAPLNNQSRMSLGTDSNDDTQLRSNNSFLHDNVD